MKRLPLLLMLHFSTTVYAGFDSEEEIPTSKVPQFSIREEDLSLEPEDSMLTQNHESQGISSMQDEQRQLFPIKEEENIKEEEQRTHSHHESQGNLSFTQNPETQRIEDEVEVIVIKEEEGELEIEKIAKRRFLNSKRCVSEHVSENKSTSENSRKGRKQGYSHSRQRREQLWSSSSKKTHSYLSEGHESIVQVVKEADQLKKIMGELNTKLQKHNMDPILEVEIDNAQDLNTLLRNLRNQTVSLEEVLCQLSNLKDQLEVTIHGGKNQNSASDQVIEKNVILTQQNYNLINKYFNLLEKQEKDSKNTQEKLIAYAQLQKEFDKLSLKKGELSERFSKLEGESKNLIAENAGLQFQYAGLKDENESLKREKQGLEVQISNLNEKLQNLQNVENENKEFKTQVSNLESQSTQLAQELEKKKQEAQQAMNNNYWQGQYNILHSQYTQLTQGLEKKEGTLKQAESGNNQLQQQYNQLERQYDKIHQETEILRSLKQSYQTVIFCLNVKARGGALQFNQRREQNEQRIKELEEALKHL